MEVFDGIATPEERKVFGEGMPEECVPDPALAGNRSRDFQSLDGLHDQVGADGTGHPGPPALAENPGFEGLAPLVS